MPTSRIHVHSSGEQSGYGYIRIYIYSHNQPYIYIYSYVRVRSYLKSLPWCTCTPRSYSVEYSMLHFAGHILCMLHHMPSVLAYCFLSPCSHLTPHISPSSFILISGMLEQVHWPSTTTSSQQCWKMQQWHSSASVWQIGAAGRVLGTWWVKLRRGGGVGGWGWNWVGELVRGARCGWESSKSRVSW